MECTSTIILVIFTLDSRYVPRIGKNALSILVGVGLQCECRSACVKCVVILENGIGYRIPVTRCVPYLVVRYRTVCRIDLGSPQVSLGDRRTAYEQLAYVNVSYLHSNVL